MVNPSSLTTAMQFLRGDGDKLGSNGGSNNVGINPLDTLTLTFIKFVSVAVMYNLPLTLNYTQLVSVEGKYFDGAVFFRLLHIIFCVFG